MPNNTDNQINNYLSEIEQLDNADLSLRNKYLQLKQILERSCKELTQRETLQFPSLFSRLVFLAQRYELPKALEWNLQNIRVKASFLLRNEDNLVSTRQYEQAQKTLTNLYTLLLGEATEVEEITEEEESDIQKPLSLEKIRVQVVEINEVDKLLVCSTVHLNNAEIRVRYDVETVNAAFNDTIARLWIGAQLNLIDSRIDDEGYYIPKSFVLEPDYLIDASAIAECFQDFAKSYLQYFRRKFEQPINSHYILMGNLANFFLDEIIYAEDAKNLKFENVFMKSFTQMPFEYSSCQDIKDVPAFRDFMSRANRHFINIKRVVLEDMPTNGFDRLSCTLEPSFFSEKYGFQGRLDLLQIAQGKEETDRIIELKSGKAPFPSNDPSKIALNHETQTIIYRLMIQSVFGKDTRQIYPTILYSSVDMKGDNLRWAAYYQRLEKDILNTRNLIVATEHDLYTGNTNTVSEVFTELFDLNNYEGNRPNFFKEKLADIKGVLNNATEVERLYFFRFINFISRELYLQKAGDEAIDTTMSQSALWTTDFVQREEALELIADLQIEEIEDGEHDMLIRFSREKGEASSNFREGEICILYPRQSEADTMLTNQILKGMVVELSSTHLLLRFRYKQRNTSFFSQYKYWAVEHDKLDHSYNSMYKGLFAFLMAEPNKRNLLLGLEEPRSRLKIDSNKELSIQEKQESVLDKALASEDYFLIVGPPGTGKTSVFARQLIERLYRDEDKNILVIAYTNRAVDELCAAISAAFGEGETACDKYIRIGSSLSCGDDYRHRLLQELSYNSTSRKELTDKIDSTRIFVGTLASIVGKPELFEMKQFHTAIIDEASQILEPQIIGLLPLFERFIMIGDHKQLSTITLQNKEHSAVSETALNEIGLYDCRNSLFERLFHTCQTKDWTQAYDTLTYHGRMHQDIADFVNTHFYDEILKEIEERQRINLGLSLYNKESKMETLVATKRLAFLPVRDKKYNISNKVNYAEADIIVSLCIALLNVYKANNKPFDKQRTLGIITPYRNQIALIKDKIRETGISELQDIMIDTVERYQGSQRDVIIVSFCMSKPYQLTYFSNMNKEGTVDRKLNVAITRAREQLFMVGDDNVLRQNPIYQKLIEKTRVDL